jgi:glutamyl-tRNA synthetase
MAVRVRFAPSPTGFLHIGGLRTALYNELFALHHRGVLILRIEDTDRTRLVAGGLENIIRTLAWAGIKPVEGPYLDADGMIRQMGGYGPYVQSERLEIYKEQAETLLAGGRAYRCFCSPERLEEVKNRQMAEKRQLMYDRTCRGLSDETVREKLEQKMPHVVRLKVPDAGSTSFEDGIRGTVSFENAVIDDQVLLKSDGYPTYHLANVVDDHLMAISHVIRGEEWLPSTPKHLLLYQAFGWEPPSFAHLPLLLNPDRSKLSKRQGDVAVEDYRKQGYVAEALVNFVALLGWNPSGDREIYSKEELVREFALEKVNRGGAVFNREKLDWLNGEYLRKLPDEQLMELSLPYFRDAGISAEKGEYLARALSLERPRAKRLAELPEATAFFFADRIALDPAMIPGKKSAPEVAADRLAGIRRFFAGLADSDFEDAKVLERKTIAFVAEQGWTNAETLWPTRVALTGREASPSPFEVAWVLGKERTLSRIDAAIRALA